MRCSFSGSPPPPPVAHQNVVECILIKRRTELLGALDVKALCAVFQTSKTLAALNKDAATWHRVYAARRAAPRAAPDVDDDERR